MLSKSSAGSFNFWSLGESKYKKAWMEGKPGIESPWWFLIALSISSSVRSLVTLKPLLDCYSYSSSNMLLMILPTDNFNYLSIFYSFYLLLPLIAALYWSANSVSNFQIKNIFYFPSLGIGCPKLFMIS